MYAVQDLPPNPHLNHLRQQAKQRLIALKAVSGVARLSDAQLLVARSYGFPSWRAMKAEVDRRNAAVSKLEHPPPLFAMARPRTTAPGGRLQRLHNPLELEGVLFPYLAATAAGVQFLWVLTFCFLAL
jgi:hypothetical protein